MILLLDIGNTRMKWAAVSGAKPRLAGALEHAGNPARLVRRLNQQKVSAVWVSQVLGGKAERPLAAAIKSRFGVAPHFARTQAEHRGLCIAYAKPARLGVDRWLAMLALWTERRKAFCVVNAGTALTFDAVTRRGKHRGGLIAPGLLTAEKAVLSATRFGVTAKTIRYTQGLGRDTESCVRQGALHACAGLIERAASQSDGARYISGGDAATLRAHLDQGWIIRPNLVLEGLLALARNNASRHIRAGGSPVSPRRSKHV